MNIIEIWSPRWHDRKILIAPWKVGYCNYGDPNTQEKNKKGKLLNTKCCSLELLDGGAPTDNKSKEKP